MEQTLGKSLALRESAMELFIEQKVDHENRPQISLHRLLTLFALFLLLCACSNRERYTAMRHGLDSINQRNRNDQPFSPADVEPYVSYFADHGNSNDRMLAHYLLGRAYHEQGEAPMALQHYQEAITAADTASKDCDFAQLSRVYGQMGDIFYYQGLFRQQLDCQQLAVRFAWIAKDTLAALVNYEQQSSAFMALENQDSAIFVTEDVAKLYTKYGYPKYAAIALGSIIRPCIVKREYEKAKKYIDIYEKESGLIDSYGNIEQKREVYYYAKGLYYLQTNNYDSAEYWFRKELLDGKDFFNQNGGAYGLAQLFKLKHNPDSAAKYYSYAYEMNDSAYMEMASAEVAKINSIYNYSRYQEKAANESKRAAQMTLWLILIIGFIVVISLVLYIILNRINQKRIILQRDFTNVLLQIEQAQSDIAFLRGQHSDQEEIINQQTEVIEGINKMIAEKDIVIEKLQEEISEFRKNKYYVSKVRRETDIFNSQEYKTFSKFVERYAIPPEDEWRKLRTKVFECLPEFHQLLLANRHHLNICEYNECIMVRLRFKPSDIVNLLQISPSYINKIRKNLLKKLFGQEGKAEVFDTLVLEIC